MPGVAIRERGITFSEPLISKVMDGSKTVTRQIISPQPRPVSPNGCPIREIVPSLLINRGDLFDVRYEIDYPAAVRCPYGAPGDRLYVKETWRPWFVITCGRRAGIHYRADDRKVCLVEEPADDDPLWLKIRDATGWPMNNEAWRSGRYMPKWAARTWLELTGVRAERLNEITEEDAYAEGIPEWKSPEQTFDPAVRFRELWDAADGKREGCDWNSNPWVFVISFRRVEREGG